MTIINFWLSPVRVVVLADTLLVDAQSNPSGVASKLAISPRLNAVSAVRGSLWCSDKWARWIDESVTLDEARDGAAHCAREIVKAWLAQCPEGPGAEFITLAWDEKAGRCVGWANFPDDDFRTIELRDGTYANPWMPGYPKAEKVPLMGVVLQQFVTAEQLGAPLDAGGPYVQATITRRGVTSRVLDAPAVAVRGAA